MHNYTDLWLRFLSSDQSKDDNSVWDQARRQLTLRDVVDGVAHFICPNQGTKTVVGTKQADLCVTVSKITGQSVFRIQCEVEKKSVQSKPPNENPSSQLFQYEPTIDELVLQCGLSLKNTLENFAVSTCNSVAYAAAQVAASQSTRIYNPLFIWGGVGYGKTHLAQGIGRRVLQTDRNKRVYFCPGDRFTNEIIEAIKNRNTEKFRQKYRKLDVLIVDDIQFISGKNTVQEEFFHTFNEIVSRGGQVVLISDRPPQQIKDIEDRLKSRFAGGMTVDISPPDFELKTAIVLIKARQGSIDIDIEAAKIMAQNAEDNRSLEGVLLSTYAYTFAKDPTKSPHITAEDVERYLRKEKTSSDAIARMPSPDSVMDTVCSYYQIKPAHIKQPNRTEKIARARHVLMYILREKMLLNYESIAHALKRKDHTTIMHGVNKIKQEVMHNQFLKNDIDIIAKNLDLGNQK